MVGIQEKRDDSVHWDTGSCFLGVVLVAVRGRSICRVAFADGTGELRALLAREFPETLLRRSARVTPLLKEVIGRLEHPAIGGAPLPLDLRGTGFQRRVWEALVRIPPGRVISYGELARRIGRPGAARAVGAACGANRIAGLIPCHRVVAANGPGGYRWGLTRKRALLAREGVDLDALPGRGWRKP